MIALAILESFCMIASAAALGSNDEAVVHAALSAAETMFPAGRLSGKYAVEERKPTSGKMELVEDIAFRITWRDHDRRIELEGKRILDKGVELKSIAGVRFGKKAVFYSKSQKMVFMEPSERPGYWMAFYFQMTPGESWWSLPDYRIPWKQMFAIDPGKQPAGTQMVGRNFLLDSKFARLETLFVGGSKASIVLDAQNSFAPISYDIHDKVDQSFVQTRWIWKQTSKGKPQLQETRQEMTERGQLSRRRCLEITSFSTDVALTSAAFDPESLSIVEGTPVRDRVAKTDSFWGRTSAVTGASDKMREVTEDLKKAGFGKKE